jgi:hypothetical protein
MDIHLISYYIGIFIVFFSQLYILFNKSSYKMMSFFAFLNIIGSLFIAYYFMHKEEFIMF